VTHDDAIVPQMSSRVRAVSLEVAPRGHPSRAGSCSILLGEASAFAMGLFSRAAQARRRRRKRQSAVDAPAEVEDVLRVQDAQQAVAYDLHRRTGQCSLLDCQAFLPGCEGDPAQCDLAWVVS
jgi:hypothetical protein